MKILIVTQKADRTDPILGFFHGWIEEFGRQADAVTVLAQYAGEYDFAENVSVCSMGKERGYSRWRQVWQFWQSVWRLRSDYDVVLVHMTPIWVVLGAPVWLLLRKPMYLWYESRGTRWPLRIAAHVVRKIFSASVYGMPIKTRKSVVVGHGIDTDFFVPNSDRTAGLLLTVGRITAAKNLQYLLQAMIELPPEYRLRIAGRPITTADKHLETEILAFIHEHNLVDRVEIGSVTQQQLLPLLQQAQVFLHASYTSLDKAVLEAMAAGCPVISCAEAVQPLLPEICQATPETFAECIQNVAALPAGEYLALSADLRHTVQREHGLSQLIGKLLQEISFPA